VLAPLRASGDGWQTRVSDSVRDLTKAGRLQQGFPIAKSSLDFASSSTSYVADRVHADQNRPPSGQRANMF